VSKRVFFIHTVSGLTGMFNDLCAELLPNASLCHVSDESLIQRILVAEGLTPVVFRRTMDHIVAAEEAGAEVIQLTCSSISPCADAARQMVSVPVLKIDEPMVRAAVEGFGRIGVIATNPGTLVPSTELVRTIAAEMGREVEVQSVLCAGAYAAWFAGDKDEHDRIVREYLLQLIDGVDVVCLAQASMARIVDTLTDEEKSVPVLSSPRRAVERLAEVVADLSRGS
jgi:Asp/Glu/hydantoin racemase